ncbi:DUF6879 family protein [Kitasatospora sp. NPDC002965]|uniref:DUF6879 family protein n=1 Tax=Kitasatospora sp. NPDC002965 TaxID=3154775 RepID=UPI0033B697A3
MSRRLRYIGSNSGNNGCPTLYEDVETGEVLVQGDAVTDPDDDLTGVELITDPVRVARACQVRDAARHFATPHRAFAAGVPSGV